MTALELTAQERDWAQMIAADIAHQMVDQASKLLAIWPEDSDMHGFGKKAADLAKAIYADSRHQTVYYAMPNLAEERLWQSRNTRGAWDSPLQPTIHVKPKWVPKVAGGEGRPGDPHRTIEMEAVEEAPTAQIQKYVDEWPQVPMPPKSRRMLRRERRHSLRRAEIS